MVEQKLGSAFFAQAGLPSPVPVGSFFDLFPVSVLTTSTLDQLTKLEPGSSFDERRFRMNVIVETKEAGFVENNWIGRELAIGDAIRLNVALPDPRCVMTTLAQDEPEEPLIRSDVRRWASRASSRGFRSKKRSRSAAENRGIPQSNSYTSGERICSRSLSGGSSSSSRSHVSDMASPPSMGTSK